jgi:RNA polymerase sigma-70 factor (ECF subfamily)
MLEEGRVSFRAVPSEMAKAEPFEAFYRREYRPVVGLVVALGGDKSSAEDLAQEAFLTARRQWEKVGTLDKPGAWVRKVVTNKSVSLWRRRSAEARAYAKMTSDRRQPAGDNPEFSAETVEVWQAVRALPKRQAIALAMTYLEDSSLDDVAEVLGCSPGTVKTHLRRGRASVARKLGVSEEDRHADR